MIPKRNYTRRSSLTRIVIKFEKFKKKKKKNVDRKYPQLNVNRYGDSTQDGK
jgi:hypothetical protein